MQTPSQIVLIAWLALLPAASKAWGFWAHRHINRMAVYSLPPQLMRFFKPHAAYLAAHAVVPDQRRYVVPAEAPRHYFDLDVYAPQPGHPAYATVPRTWAAARALYGDDSLQRHGLLPYHLQHLQWQLTQAFRARQAARVLYLAAELGHYLADAHVPLHTTANYDGQFTHQRGIHSLWESHLPERFAGSYGLQTGRATVLDDVPAAVWAALLHAHTLLPQLLAADSALRATTPHLHRHAIARRGQNLQRTVSDEYARRYHDLLQGQVEAQMRAAIRLLAACWTTAWVDAGQPDADSLWAQHPQPQAETLAPATIPRPDAGADREADLPTDSSLGWATRPRLTRPFEFPQVHVATASKREAVAFRVAGFGRDRRAGVPRLRPFTILRPMDFDKDPNDPFGGQQFSRSSNYVSYNYRYSYRQENDKEIVLNERIAKETTLALYRGYNSRLSISNNPCLFVKPKRFLFRNRHDFI